MKIVLYFTEQSSRISKFVSLVTNSDITHASIINRDINYDTDLLRDAFGKSEILLENPQRFCIVYDFGLTDCQDWIDSSVGIPYDLLGYFLWIFGKNPKKKMHCFDTVIEALIHLGYPVPKKIIRRPTGTKLQKYLDTLSVEKSIVQCQEVI